MISAGIEVSLGPCVDVKPILDEAAGKDVVVVRGAKAARHSGVQQNPQATHCLAFSGSSSGDPSPNTAGQHPKSVSPTLEVRPTSHAVHVSAPSCAEYVPAGHGEQGGQPPRPPPPSPFPPSGSGIPWKPIGHARPCSPEMDWPASLGIGAASLKGEAEDPRVNAKRASTAPPAGTRPEGTGAVLFRKSTAE